ncbi:hypothetical protein EPUS_09051 [Endocarpon pusillum Z07020]|uniref:Uncharacterized protein n=1 Tax=Endocarpon pusillum (strain Z07020 / HMAS-L-300199) TaxID=1263415 RepID=U1HQK8_ENDPU|nr:uncharacterized protein EPUS_09051 [Endocarpon pusillum Z07020]ERF71379.1 hypothetical protein EPUS_09051 [Endocarpon pusillum Z07020]
MHKAHLAFLVLLPAFLAAVLVGILLQWLLMKREQRRIEDLVELRTKSRNESVTAVGESNVDVRGADEGAGDGGKGTGKEKGNQGVKVKGEGRGDVCERWREGVWKTIPGSFDEENLGKV